MCWWPPPPLAPIQISSPATDALFRSTNDMGSVSDCSGHSLRISRVLRSLGSIYRVQPRTTLRSIVGAARVLIHYTDWRVTRLQSCITRCSAAPSIPPSFDPLGEPSHRPSHDALRRPDKPVNVQTSRSFPRSAPRTSSGPDHRSCAKEWCRRHRSLPCEPASDSSRERLPRRPTSNPPACHQALPQLSRPS